MLQQRCMPITALETLPQVILLIIYCLEESLHSPLMLNLDLKGEDNRAPYQVHLCNSIKEEA